ncbi:bifunctional glutamate--cysteine ligase GshA/glutathione synthetase GshB [Listeria costaricensis]|uniref:bifunctional glutamate--cysteine ligase GshA/glutathione synthetase GshB n=1 Tax=Listeria costaricensis TaxID=2026604 RepID=UPI000C06E145|nr:bifunctional glutamate--cysteine ligase GshA/glutathione synthetase GshB [Listeria costaricensis]
MNHSTAQLNTRKEPFASLPDYGEMELSTQILIQSAFKFGLAVEVLDRSENFIRITNPQNQQVEYVKEATKTSLDKYSQVLIMENKEVTKLVLSEQQIHVPSSFTIHQKAEGLKLFHEHKLPSQLVVKPNSTNFGKGITVFSTGYLENEFSQALDKAFQEDQTILLETFQPGKEYRILVLGDEVVAVLNRVPANVIGDGVHTIEELVRIKNQNPLRGQNYTRPLEFLKLAASERAFLAAQNLTVHSIPACDQQVFLRENSNISTGGDSIDFTDQLHASYKNIALAAAQALDVRICGVDIIIENIDTPAKPDNYAIIEVNFNPAIHIHCYPFEGVNRQVGDKIIQLLFFNHKKEF